MNKYFYLIRRNKWSKPFTALDIILLVIRGKIKEFTVVWYNHLCPDGASNPYECIHRSKVAKELNFLPKFIFRKYFGVNKIFISGYTKIQEKFKHDDRDFDLDKPLEAPKLLENALEKKLIPSIRAIQNMSSGGEYSVELEYKTLENKLVRKSYPIRFLETQTGYYEFQVIMSEFPNVGGVKYMDSYGLDKELILISEVDTLRIKDSSITDFSTQYPYLPQILTGRFTHINQVVNSDYKNTFFRLILSMEVTDMISPLNILARTNSIVFDKEHFNVHSTVIGTYFRSGGAYTELTIQGRSYHYYCLKEYGLIIIDCMDRDDLTSFKGKTEIIRLAFAFLSGKLYRGTAYYVSASSNLFEEIEGVWYEKELALINTNRQIINPRYFFENYKTESQAYQEKYRKYHELFSNQLFSNFCNALLEQEELLRAVQLIVSASGNSDPIQQGALYSVAIETLTSFISEKHSERVNPIKDKQLAKEVVSLLSDTLTQYQAVIGEEGVNILKNKLENINQPTNRDKLVIPFQIYGLELSDKDKENIGRRNEYLHGRTPLSIEQTFELETLALDLHYLVGCLILKYIGYAGFVIYLPAWALINNKHKFKESIDEKSQMEFKFLEELREAAKAGDPKRYDDIRLKWLNYNQDYLPMRLIKII